MRDNTEPLDFSLVLKQDLANIVAKSASGAPLTAREHKMIEAEIERQKKGAPSTGQTEPAQVSTEKAEPVEIPKKRGRNGFFHQYAHYEEVYAHNLRTIKRWVDLGKKNEDPIDLDDPEQVHAWWSRNMKKDHPAGIQQALIAWRKQHPPVASVSAPPQEVELVPEEEPLTFNASDDEIGIDAMFARLEQFELIFARKAKEPGGAKVWLDTISRITATLEKLRREKEQQGLLIPKDQAEVILASLHGPIEQSVRGGCAEFCKAVGVPHTPAIEANWSSTCDRLFLQLCKEVFHAV